MEPLKNGKCWAIKNNLIFNSDIYLFVFLSKAVCANASEERNKLFWRQRITLHCNEISTEIIGKKSALISEIHWRYEVSPVNSFHSDMFFTIIFVCSGSPKPEFKIIIHLDDPGKEPASSKGMIGIVNCQWEVLFMKK